MRVSEVPKSDASEQPVQGFAGSHRMPPISLPLHEALGLILLFQEAAPELIQSLQLDDVFYGFSAAQGYLRLRRSISELFGDEEGIDAIAVESAMLDQEQEKWLS